MRKVSPENWIKRVDETVGVTLAAGTYVKGALIVESATPGTFEFADVDSAKDGQRVLVLRDAVDTATDGDAAIGVTGEFSKAKITFHGAQTADTLSGALQRNGIYLTTWEEK